MERMMKSKIKGKRERKKEGRTKKMINNLLQSNKVLMNRRAEISNKERRFKDS